MTGDGQDPELFPYPRRDVVGVFIDEAAFGIACERLEQTGFGPDQDEVLHGETGLARIDTTGETHGWMGKMFRRLQNTVTDEDQHAAPVCGVSDRRSPHRRRRRR